MGQRQGKEDRRKGENEKDVDNLPDYCDSEEEKAEPEEVSESECTEEVRALRASSPLERLS